MLRQATRTAPEVATVAASSRPYNCPAMSEAAISPAPPAEGTPDSTRRPSPLLHYLPVTLMALATAAYAIFFGWLSLDRYWSFQMHALDMGNMGQAAWNTLHGHPFAFTNMRLPYAIEAWRTTTRLSFHVEFLFPVISLVYVIYPHPESLLVLQTMALASGAIAVYLISRDMLGSRWLALLFSLSYLLFPALQALNLYEFHPVALATPLLLYAFLFMERRQPVPFVLCGLAATGTKEEIGLIVALFGLYAALFVGLRRTGFGLAAVGLAWSLFAVLVVEHHFRQPGTVTYLHTRYGYLGHGIHGALNTLLYHPVAIVHVLFVWPKLVFLERLLAPLGYLSLLAPVALLLGLPTFVLDLFSQDFHMYSGLGDNAAELISVVVVASIIGATLLIRFLGRWISGRWIIIGLVLYLLGQSLWSQRVDGFTPIGSAFQRPSIGPHQRLENRFVAMIPPGVPVSTQDGLDPALSSRRYVYLFPDTGVSGNGRLPVPPLAPADIALLDVSAPTYPLPSFEIQSYARDLMHRGWGVVTARDGLILIARGRGSATIPAAFYSYLDGSGARVSNLLRARSRDLEILGYDRARTDLPNHAIPNLAYTVYVRPVRRLHEDLQPILYETQNWRLIGCSRDPLGLAWLPTSRWRPGHTYAVRLAPLETQTNTPGTAVLWLGIMRMSRNANTSCAQIWSQRGQLWPAGTLPIQF